MDIFSNIDLGSKIRFLYGVFPAPNSSDNFLDLKVHFASNFAPMNYMEGPALSFSTSDPSQIR